MPRLTRSAKEIAAEVGRLARTDPDAARHWPADLVFVAGLHGDSHETGGNWHLVVFPPVPPSVLRALYSAAEVVQQRWDLRVAYPGGPTLQKRAGAVVQGVAY